MFKVLLMLKDGRKLMEYFTTCDYNALAQFIGGKNNPAVGEAVLLQERYTDKGCAYWFVVRHYVG